MPDFVVMKRVANTGSASDWQPTVIALGAKDEEAAASQGYTGEGRYKAIEWPAAEGSEFDLGAPGAPPVTPVSEGGSV